MNRVIREMRLAIKSLESAVKFARELDKEVQETLAWLEARRAQTLREAARKVGA